MAHSNGSLTEKSLAPITRRRLETLVKVAKLPTKLPWPRGVTAKDLSKTGTYADRFTDGMFEVRMGTKRWIIDGGVTETDAIIRWDIRIDPRSGRVVACPTRAGAKTPEPFGFPHRNIGSLGPLLPLFPSLGTTTADFGLPLTYASADDVRRLRTSLVRALKTS